MNNAILIQARYNSKRLPGKIIFKISRKEILLHVYERCKKSKIKNIIVLTSKNKSDNPIVNICKKKKLNFLEETCKMYI